MRHWSCPVPCCVTQIRPPSSLLAYTHLLVLEHFRDSSNLELKNSSITKYHLKVIDIPSFSKSYARAKFKCIAMENNIHIYSMQKSKTYLGISNKKKMSHMICKSQKCAKLLHIWMKMAKRAYIRTLYYTNCPKSILDPSVFHWIDEWNDIQWSCK